MLPTVADVLALEPVRRQGAMVEHRAGIVDQHVDPADRRDEVGGETPDLVEAREIVARCRPLIASLLYTDRMLKRDSGSHRS